MLKVEEHVQFAVRTNIQPPSEEQLIAIKVALLARTSVIPLLPPNTMKKVIADYVRLRMN